MTSLRLNGIWTAALTFAVTALAGPGYVLGIFGPEPSPSLLISQAAAQPAQSPPLQPQAAPAALVQGDIKTAEDLLTRLETADKDIKSLEADMHYDRVFDLAGDRQIRRGKIYYEDTKLRDTDGNPAKASRRFAVRFDNLQLGNRPREAEEQIIVFDGEWLVEKHPARKEIIKRHVVTPGQNIDPLKIGEGPLPLPIGQKRDDILKRFTAQLLPAEQELKANHPDEQKALEKLVKDSYQLKLLPKDPDPDFKEIRLWYKPEPGTGNLLPRMARAVNRQGDVSLVLLLNVKLNQPIPPGVMDAAVPEGWEEHVEELKAENRR